jgi:hypothetical protein
MRDPSNNPHTANRDVISNSGASGLSTGDSAWGDGEFVEVDTALEADEPTDRSGELIPGTLASPSSEKPAALNPSAVPNRLQPTLPSQTLSPGAADQTFWGALSCAVIKLQAPAEAAEASSKDVGGS